MYEKLSHMSLWELAHRWNDADPMTPSDAPIPLAVQPILRMLSLGIANGKLIAHSPLIFEDHRGNPGVHYYADDALPLSSNDVETLLCGKLDRPLFESLLLPIEAVLHWALSHDLEIPDFLIPGHAWTAHPTPTKHSQQMSTVAHQAHKDRNALKKQFVRYCKSSINTPKFNAMQAARDFYSTLTTVDKLSLAQSTVKARGLDLAKREENAIRILTGALRDFKKGVFSLE